MCGVEEIDGGQRRRVRGGAVVVGVGSKPGLVSTRTAGGGMVDVIMGMGRGCERQVEVYIDFDV